MIIKEKKARYIIGIDEVGRGPLAGPVTVGAIIIAVHNYKKVHLLCKGIRDSKKLSSKKREEWYKIIQKLGHRGLIRYKYSNVSSKVIDKIGISESLKLAVKRTLEKLDVLPNNSFIYLDGSLYAPKIYPQKTIIKGDEKKPIISLASIYAKVSRDKYLFKLSKKFPEYKLEIHKGYGTKMHYKNIKKYGISPIHRVSFLKNI